MMSSSGDNLTLKFRFFYFLFVYKNFKNLKRETRMMLHMEAVKDREIEILRFEPCEPSEDVLENNLILSDKMRDMANMSGAVMGWMKAHADKTLADLEDVMRSLDMNTRLISVHYTQIPEFKKHVDEGKAEVKMLDKSPTEHVVWISCRSRENALKELLSYRASEEENHALLEKTGFMTMKDPADISEEEKLDEKSKEKVNNISDGTLKMVIEKKSLRRLFQAAMNAHPNAYITLVSVESLTQYYGLIEQDDNMRVRCVSRVQIKCNIDASGETKDAEFVLVHS